MRTSRVDLLVEGVEREKRNAYRAFGPGRQGQSFQKETGLRDVVD
jgi:hypothetical protein